jgi:hypothetical protein
VVEGRTIITGQKLGINEFRNHQTFAMSSLFLNSPLTSTTLPFSSNSVHRSFASLADLGDMLRPRLNIGASPPSSKKDPSGKSSDFSGRGIFCLRPHRWRSHPLSLLDACHPLPSLELCHPFLSFDAYRCEVYDESVRLLPRLALCPGRPCVAGVPARGHKKSRLRKPASRVVGFDIVVDTHLWGEAICNELGLREGGETRGAAWSNMKPRGLALKKQSPSDCDLRNLSRVEDGVGACKLDRMAAFGHQRNCRQNLPCKERHAEGT